MLKVWRKYVEQNWGSKEFRIAKHDSHWSVLLPKKQWLFILNGGFLVFYRHKNLFGKLCSVGFQFVTDVSGRYIRSCSRVQQSKRTLSILWLRLPWRWDRFETSVTYAPQRPENSEDLNLQRRGRLDSRKNKKSQEELLFGASCCNDLV